jgi:hypothetical protein
MKRLSKEKQQSCACLSHFHFAKYLKHTDICVGARVAILTVNFLPEAGLYSRVIGNVVDIFYQDKPVGPNDKQHYHLLNHVLVDFPHLKLPSNIASWDKLDKTVSRQNIHDVNKMFQMILTQTNSMYLSQWKPNSAKNHAVQWHSAHWYQHGLQQYTNYRDLKQGLTRMTSFSI